MPASTLGLIVELLSFCVQNHQYRIKYYILRSETVSKVPFSPFVHAVQSPPCVSSVLTCALKLGLKRVLIKDVTAALSVVGFYLMTRGSGAS